MNEFFASIMEALGNYRYLILYGVSIILGFLFLKGKKKLFLIPSLLMTVLILNPLTRNIWNKYNDYAYWRLLWILPVIPVCAALPAALAEKIQKLPLRIGAVLLCVAIFGVTGSFVYAADGTGFVQAENAEKVPYTVKEIADQLLEMEENPRVVSDAEISIYLRQYSGRLQTPYGRDIVYGNPPQSAVNLYQALVRGEMEEVAQMMRSGGYRYLVTANWDLQRKSRLEAAGFESRGQVNGYGIYQLN